MNHLNPKYLILFVLFIFLFHCGSREKAAKNRLIEIPGFTMGTTYRVKVVKNSQWKAADTDTINKRLSTGITDRLDAVNQQMSMWREDSEISRFNRHRENTWFGISPDTARVIAEALETSKKSDGAFDITVGPLVNLWGFGPAKEKHEVPNELQIKEALAKIGYQKLAVRSSPPAVKKEDPGIYCDLSAIAKGFGVDKVAEYLETEGIANYLVEIGGEVRVRGMNHEGTPWRVAIASPTPDGSSGYQKVVFLQNASMATSGDYHNYFEKDGIRYSHTIDPGTGRPITHKLASVTVVHASCMTADALATAIDVLGPGKGYELALKEDLAVFLVIREKDSFVEKMTPRFQALLSLSTEAGSLKVMRESSMGLNIDMVRIPAGEFMMGSEKGAPDELPLHKIRVNGFYLGRTEVTVGQWRIFARESGYVTQAELRRGGMVRGEKGREVKQDANWRNPYQVQTDEHPVVLLSWKDAQAFCQWLSKKTGLNYRLPTEAEWEYACRAGSNDERYGDLDSIAWYEYNADGHTHPVGGKQPNSFGLYDMLGNVWEWCQDRYDKNYYKVSPGTDPTGPATGGHRISRGGSWCSKPPRVRTPFRRHDPYFYRFYRLGFRLARSDRS
jgi:thiamine biosynthesis lipoprotein